MQINRWRRHAARKTPEHPKKHRTEPAGSPWSLPVALVRGIGRVPNLAAGSLSLQNQLRVWRAMLLRPAESHLILTPMTRLSVQRAMTGEETEALQSIVILAGFAFMSIHSPTF